MGTFIQRFCNNVAACFLTHNYDIDYSIGKNYETYVHSLICSVLSFCLPVLLTAQIVVDFEDINLSTPDSFIAETFESGGVTFSGTLPFHLVLYLVNRTLS